MTYYCDVPGCPNHIPKEGDTLFTGRHEMKIKEQGYHICGDCKKAIDFFIEKYNEKRG